MSVYLMLLGIIPAAEENSDDNMERHCDSLFMCIITTLNEGLRNGGGIGDILRKPSSQVQKLFVHFYLQYIVKPVSFCILNQLNLFSFKAVPVKLCSTNS